MVLGGRSAWQLVAPRWSGPAARDQHGAPGSPARVAPPLAGGLVGVALALAPAAPAAAHASLVKTDPAEGQVLAEPQEGGSLTFDETVSATDGVQMYDARGRPSGRGHLRATPC